MTSDALGAFRRRYLERARIAVGAEAPSAVQLDAGPPARPGRVLAGWWREPGDGLAVLPNPWDERTAIPLYDDLTWRTAERLCTRLGAFLASLHGEDRPSSYWQLLLGPWVLHFVSIVAERELYCSTALALAPGAPFLGARPAPPPATTEAGIGALFGDGGNRRLMAAIGALAGAPVEELDDPPAPASPRRRLADRLLAPPAARARHLAELSRAALLGGRRGRTLMLVHVTQLPVLDALRLRARVRGLRAGVRGRPAQLPVVAEDPAARGRLGELSAGDPLERTVIALLPRFAPRTVIEGWPQVVAASERRFGTASAAIVGNYWVRELENEFVARSVAAERRIAFLQHGGTYCQALANPQERLEKAAGATFLSWGRCRGARNVPSPHLARLRDSHRGGRRTLLVEWLVPTYPHRFSSTPLGNQVHAGVALLESLVRQVPPGPVRSSLLLKRYPGAPSHAARPPLLERLPHPRRLQSPFAVDWLRRARIAVVTYPDTTLIEAMVLGVPLIGLWRADHWDMLPEAGEHFRRLEQLGVAFSDGDAAADRLAHVYEHASEWWREPDIRAARRDFLDRFATGGDWRRRWTDLLRELER